MEITHEQKLQAIAAHLYNNPDRPAWEPYEGAYYVIIRADLELFQVVSLDADAGTLQTKRVDDEALRMQAQYGGNTPDTWEIDGFTTEGFGPQRIPMPEYILGIDPPATKPKPA